MLLPEGPKNVLKHYLGLLGKKLAGINASPYAIAAGFACGAAVSFTPFVGFHTLLTVLLVLMIRANLAAGLIGTAVGNPWTFPLIWPAVLFTGRWLLHESSSEKVDFLHLFDNLAKAAAGLDGHLFFADIWPVLRPMAVGCVPFCLIVWIGSYLLVKHTIEKVGAYRRRKL